MYVAFTEHKKIGFFDFQLASEGSGFAQMKIDWLHCTEQHYTELHKHSESNKTNN